MKYYKPNEVISEFKKIIKKLPECEQKVYYEILVEFLILEQRNKKIVTQANKELFHYFQYDLPYVGNCYFLFLYNSYNPVRVHLESFNEITELTKIIEKIVTKIRDSKKYLTKK